MPDDPVAVEPAVDEPVVEPVEPEPEPDPGPSEAETLRAQLEATRAELDATRRQSLDALTRQQQPYQREPVADPTAERAKLEADYFKDPAGYTAAKAKSEAEDAARKVFQAVGSQLTEMAISTYRSAAQADPDFKSALSEFDKAVERAKPGLVGLAPAQVAEALDFMRDAAIGRSYRAAKTRAAAKPAPKTVQAPNLGGKGAGAPKGEVGVFEDEVDQQAYDQFIKYGFKPEDAKRMVEEQE